MQALLDELGAKCARIPCGADAETLCRAMNEGRISAVIVPRAQALAPQGGLAAQLQALHTLLTEAREAGVPLTLLLSDESVYRAGAAAPAGERAPIGGETRAGLIQSMLDLYADGFARGLLGDPVRVLPVRHMPCLGCGHPAVAQYAGWCRALDAGDVPEVAHPAMQGVFLHPLDACCGALLLGARLLSGDTPLSGPVNLPLGQENLLANRTAALRFVRENGGTRPIRETEPPHGPPIPLTDGAQAQFVCGARCLVPGGEALNQLLALVRAARQGPQAQAQVIRAQTQAYLRSAARTLIRA